MLKTMGTLVGSHQEKAMPTANAAVGPRPGSVSTDSKSFRRGACGSWFVHPHAADRSAELVSAWLLRRVRRIRLPAREAVGRRGAIAHLPPSSTRASPGQVDTRLWRRITPGCPPLIRPTVSLSQISAIGCQAHRRVRNFNVMSGQLAHRSSVHEAVDLAHNLRGRSAIAQGSTA
jgi:hypothetical protein